MPIINPFQEMDSSGEISLQDKDTEGNRHTRILAQRTPLERWRMPLTWLWCMALVSLVVVTKSAWPEAGLMSGTLLLMGISLALIGCVGRIWCSLYIDGFKTRQLVSCGPYSICRNPLYFFSAIGAVGVALGTATFLIPAIVAVCFSVYYRMIIRAEERRLNELYGVVFEEYCASVPAFFPKISLFRTPETYVIHTRSVGRSMLHAMWFVWFTMLAHLLFQLQQRTAILPNWLNSY